MKSSHANHAQSNNRSLYVLAVMIGVVLVAMAIVSPGNYYGVDNLRSMIFQFPEYGLIAYGMMLAMMSGGIDLSLVGIANLAGIVAAKIMLDMGGSGLSIALSCLAALCVGCLCGLFNGFMIGQLRVPAMLVTLCGLHLYTGLGLAITTGPALNGLPEVFIQIANGSLGSFPNVLFIFAVVLAGIAFLMRCTVFGKQLLFMGSNNDASRYSGIDTLKVTLLTYMFSGILGSISGLLISSHFGSAKSDYGSSYTLLSLLIAVLGGIHPDGGRGSVLGVTLSILLLQLISNAFSVLEVDTTLKTFVYGLLLIGSLSFTALTANRKPRRRRADAAAVKNG